MPAALIDKAFAFIAKVGEGFILLIRSDKIIIYSSSLQVRKIEAFFLDLRQPGYYE
jgi:hypothetical protein